MQIMGVVNVTPDSFYDGGHHATADAAVIHALQCVEAGADILDIGGESSRPGSEPVHVDEELRRVIPVVSGIRQRHPDIPISVDTTKSRVLREAAVFGIQYANDITALRGDPEMAATIAQLGVNTILMHMQGTPGTMQAAPFYHDVVAEVRAFLEEQAVVAMRAGISRDRILFDPGIGFGKTVEHNVALLQYLSEIAVPGLPLVVGTSRKSFIGKLISSHTSVHPHTRTSAHAHIGTLAHRHIAVPPPEQRLSGSLATLPAMLAAGVTIVRTHDVAATRQFLTVYNILMQRED